METAIGPTPRAAPDPLVSRREHHRQPSHRELHELGIAVLHVLYRNLLHFVIAVAHRLNKGWVWVIIELLRPVEERVRNAVDDSEGNRLGYSFNVLYIEQGLANNRKRT